jgi:hypothetical protein
MEEATSANFASQLNLVRSWALSLDEQHRRSLVSSLAELVYPSEVSTSVEGVKQRWHDMSFFGGDVDFKIQPRHMESSTLACRPASSSAIDAPLMSAWPDIFLEPDLTPPASPDSSQLNGPAFEQAEFLSRPDYPWSRDTVISSRPSVSQRRYRPLPPPALAFQLSRSGQDSSSIWEPATMNRCDCGRRAFASELGVSKPSFPLLRTPSPVLRSPLTTGSLPDWLRGLRLHKYASCLQGLQPAELFELDEDDLEAMGVDTIGARRKLLKVSKAVPSVNKRRESHC